VSSAARVGQLPPLAVGDADQLVARGGFHVADDRALDFRVQEEALQIALAHAAAADEAEADFVIRTRFASAKGTDNGGA